MTTLQCNNIFNNNLDNFDNNLDNFNSNLDNFNMHVVPLGH
jgi:hypothetical protein